MLLVPMVVLVVAVV
jgi:hypothetical protein